MEGLQVLIAAAIRQYGYPAAIGFAVGYFANDIIGWLL